VEALAINANCDPTRFASFGLPVLPDPVDGFIGPLAGLLAALRWATKMDCRLALTAPADTPFLPADLGARLRDGIGNAEIAVARSGGAIHPTIALWNAAQADELADWLGDDGHRAVHEWIGSRRAAAVDFDDDDRGDPFFNVNTPADLALARRHLQNARTASVPANASVRKR
jgi:molybdopterin-guanine dinucleotide biosynthesis protein A